MTDFISIFDIPEVDGIRDGDYVSSLNQHPRKSDPAGGGVIFLADFLQIVCQLEDVREVLQRTTS